MAWKLTEAYVQLGAPLGNLKKDLGAAEKTVFASVKQMASMARNIGLQLSIGGAAITGVSGLLAKFAMDAEETQNLFEVSMGKMADAARQWSESMASSLGLNRIEVQRMVGTFNVMFKSMGEGEQEAFKMSKQLTQLAFDMSSFFNLRPEIAFEKLQAGITGEIEPLKRLGILLNQSTLEAKALTMGITEQWTEIDELTKVHIRLAAIMDQTKAAQGDLERTSESATNQLRSLRSLFDEIAISLGKALLPTLKVVLEKTRALAAAFLNWSEENRALLQVLVPLAAALGAFGVALGPLLIFLPTLLTIFEGLEIVLLAMQSPIALLVIALASIGALVVPWDRVKKSIENIVKPSGDAATNVGDMATASEDAKTSLTDINPVVKTLTDSVKTGFEGANASIKTFKSQVETAKDEFGVLTVAARSDAKNFSWTVKQAGDSMRDVFDTAGNTVITAGANMATAGTQGEDAGFKVRDGFNEGAAAIEEMNRIINEESTKAMLDLQGEMTKYQNSIDDTKEKTVSWQEANMRLFNAFKDAAKDTLDWFSDFFSRFADDNVRVFNDMVDTFTFSFGDFFREMKTQFEFLKGFLRDLPNLLLFPGRVIGTPGTLGPVPPFGSSGSMSAGGQTSVGPVTFNIVQREGENAEALARRTAQLVLDAERFGLAQRGAFVTG